MTTKAISKYSLVTRERVVKNARHISRSAWILTPVRLAVILLSSVVDLFPYTVTKGVE